jgi:hypothetical protein
MQDKVTNKSFLILGEKEKERLEGLESLGNGVSCWKVEGLCS